MHLQFWNNYYVYAYYFWLKKYIFKNVCNVYKTLKLIALKDYILCKKLKVGDKNVELFIKSD